MINLLFSGVWTVIRTRLSFGMQIHNVTSFCLDNYSQPPIF